MYRRISKENRIGANALHFGCKLGLRVLPPNLPPEFLVSVVVVSVVRWSTASPELLVSETQEYFFKNRPNPKYY
jgi:hypothetical protein